MPASDSRSEPPVALLNLDALQSEYVATLKLIGLLHRLLLDMVEDEFDRRGEPGLTGAQALLLFHIGDGGLTAGELKADGHYAGSNIAYHLRKLLDDGYVAYVPSANRRTRFGLTAKGAAARQVVHELLRRQLRPLEVVAELSAQDFIALNKMLARLKRYWADHVRYRL